MRFLCFISVLSLLALNEVNGATTSSCENKVQAGRFFNTCYADVNNVDDSDFTFPSVDGTKYVNLEITRKEGVKFLPKELNTAFPSMVGIRVSHCSVTSINEDNFKGLSKLKNLYLNSNKIENIASSAFADLVDLRSLDLSRNKIQQIDAKLFSHLTSITRILLSHNEIASLDDSTFDNLDKLQNLDLSNNKLERISKDLFGTVGQITTIDLSANKIKFVDVKAFALVPLLEGLNIEGNVCLDKKFWKSEGLEENLTEFCSEAAH